LGFTPEMRIMVWNWNLNRTLFTFKSLLGQTQLNSTSFSTRVRWLSRISPGERIRTETGKCFTFNWHSNTFNNVYAKKKKEKKVRFNPFPYWQKNALNKIPSSDYTFLTRNEQF
jgi:hypothetical protein